MNYLSLEFFAAFLLFFTVYWSFFRCIRAQNILTLAASYLLVMSYNLYFALDLLLYSIGIYLFALWMHATRQRRLVFIFAVSLALLHLCFMKYFDFFREYGQSLAGHLHWRLSLPAIEILLPVGISYYTFHSITYLVSVYQRHISPGKPLYPFLLIAFFPTLIAGPVCRAEEMFPRFAAPAPRRIDNSGRIFILIISALIKKLWFAAWLAQHWSEPILNNPGQYLPAEVLAALYAYTWQIYFDFSGYTDLVIALALLLGIRIPENFDMPYAATNLRDFWHRWHISLSNWIRDYLYIPLGGNRKGFGRTLCNLFIAMLLSGLWHGAANHYIMWGAMHGMGLAGLNITDKLIGKNRITMFFQPLARFFTLHYIVLTWAVFYSDDNENTLEIFHALTGKLTTDTPHEALFLIIAFNLLLLFYPYTGCVVSRAAALWGKIPWLLQPFILLGVLLLISTYAPAGIPNFLYADF